RQTIFSRDWSSDVCSSDLGERISSVLSRPNRRNRFNMNAGNLHPTLGVMSVRLVQESFGVPKVSRKEIIGRMNNRVLTSAALNRTGRKIGRASCRERV